MQTDGFNKYAKIKMSKSMNMLRTRRRDNNVKPNRRLDRKSSRGMIYENEELRLKTININAEIERGQSDIKKLRRENEMLKKEIWCLRDEYEKLDKLLKDKDFSSSSSTCSSDSETCSSCSNGSREVETSQNAENVEKTNMKNVNVEFDHLSIVAEENSAENSGENSNRTSTPNEKDIIQPDQGYPSFPIATTKAPKNFFSPLMAHKMTLTNNQITQPGTSYNYYDTEASQPTFQPISFLYSKQNEMLPLAKTASDIIVKMDNQNFKMAPSDNSQDYNTLTRSSFSNGGNLEELLHDIETISQDILKISDATNSSKMANLNNLENAAQENAIQNVQNGTIPYKSELQVVLMPTPMPLIGFEKYRNLQTSQESINSHFDNTSDCADFLSVSNQNLAIINGQRSNMLAPDHYYGTSTSFKPQLSQDNFLNNLPLNGDNIDFLARYDPQTFDRQNIPECGDLLKPEVETCDNLLEVSVSSENEENLKFNTSKTDLEVKKEIKSPKLSIRRKVSIHFKGKKDKKKNETKAPKSGLFDIKFGEPKSTLKISHQKTPSVDSKKSVEPVANDPKTIAPDLKSSGSSDLKSSDKKHSSLDEKSSCSDRNSTTLVDKKPRKSVSISPDRKHVTMKEDGAKKSHKKHGSGKKAEKLRQRRSTISTDRVNRERSFSVCTDRSNILDPRFGFSSNYSICDDMSDTNSLSSSGSARVRKMSNISNFPVSGKIPWCGCWGNGCL